MMKIHKTLRVGVTGLSNSGKTVFLTSLLWQLSEFADASFILEGRTNIQGWRELREERDREAFPFHQYRDALSRRKEWPAKTSDWSRFVCEYDRSDMRFFRQRLNLFDFPGERVADAAIAAYSNYDDWCAHMLRHWNSDSGYAEAIEPYLKLMQRPDVEIDELLHEYRRVMARLILGFKPFISPSTFLLDRDGGSPKGKDVEELAKERQSGLPESEFCPLSSMQIQRFDKMALAYRKYRREVVLPVYRRLAQCRRLVVLVDVPALLMGGVDRYNDERQITMDLFDTLRSESSIGGLLRQIEDWRWPKLDRVAIVAAKADLVLPGDIDQGRLDRLLRDMARRAQGLLPSAKIEWFVCSAVRSTKEGKASQTLVGRRFKENPERELMEFHVPPLPDEWPQQWDPGDFNYQDVWPEVPRNFQKPPLHIGLDKIFDFLTR